MFEKIGVQYYEIMGNGCLNGCYLNFETGQVFNEIARKSDGSKELPGRYYCSYTNQDSGGVIDISNETLEIVEISNNQFSFTWTDADRKINWLGHGGKISDSQVLVKYRKPTKSDLENR